MTAGVWEYTDGALRVLVRAADLAQARASLAGAFAPYGPPGLTVVARGGVEARLLLDPLRVADDARWQRRQE